MVDSSYFDERYVPITPQNLARQPEWAGLSPAQRESIQVVSQVVPLRANRYVIDHLIDWQRGEDDPIYRLVFPHREMLAEAEFAEIHDALLGDPKGLAEVVRKIRGRLNPHPGGQMTANVARLHGQPLAGLQHKYAETVLFFPSQAQTCHAYCTYCFRWPQFIGDPKLRIESRETGELVAYLKAHPEVTDVLLTGGDPMIMSTATLCRYVEPLLEPGLEHVRNIRIGTKSIAYWPQRFVTDNDADDCLRLFERIVASGKHLAMMVHFSHPVELRPAIAQEAVRRIRSTGAEIRMQAPLIRHVNDSSAVWAELWRLGVHLGMIPYYMFVERDTGPRSYFEVPLARGFEIFRQAYTQLSGLGRSVRGPIMSAFPGKVRVVGVSDICGERVFVLELLQARDSSWIGRPFFAHYDPTATWLDDLRPAFGEPYFFFDSPPGTEEDKELAPAEGLVQYA